MRQRRAYCLTTSCRCRTRGADGVIGTTTSRHPARGPEGPEGIGMAADASAGDAVEARIRAATLTCVGRWGVSKTTLDDIARAAGCSRATIYRTFPGGKDTVMLATFAGETASFFAELAVAI